MTKLSGRQAAGAISAATNFDPSIASSALQKAIRRGRVEVALRAARLLAATNADRLWRRLTVIAMEDVGIADVGLVAHVLEVSGRRVWRAQNGGEEAVVHSIVERLCASPKSRDACDLLVIADLLPELEGLRAQLFDLDAARLVDLLVPGGVLELCTLAAWYLAGTDRFPAFSLLARAGDFGLLIQRLEQLGADPDALHAARLGSTRTREGFPISIPLISLYAQHLQVSVEPEHPSSLGQIGHWPSEAFDMHTRVGLAAIRSYLLECGDMRDVLGQFMPQHKQTDFLGHLIFRLEGAAVDRRLRYAGQHEIEDGAKEAHLTYAHVPRDAIAPAEAVLRRTFGDLHAARLHAAGMTR